MPYHLVHDYVSHDTTENLLHLLEGAHQGDVIGIAYVALLRKRRYITNVAGVCIRDATNTRGAVAVLDDDLAEMIRSRDPDETR